MLIVNDISSSTPFATIFSLVLMYILCNTFSNSVQLKVSRYFRTTVPARPRILPNLGAGWHDVCTMLDTRHLFGPRITMASGLNVSYRSTQRGAKRDRRMAATTTYLRP